MVRPAWGALVLALVLTLPSAWAGWGAKGGVEPDTAYDLGWMWSEPETSRSSTVRYVYFSGFAGVAPGVGTSLNPNLASLETSFLPTPYYPLAILGVWKDCNLDGYVGLGDNAALEYRAELLPEGHVCPVETPLPGAAHLVHNDGLWVQELTPIGYDDVRSIDGQPVDTDPRNFNDTGARVWADWGLPESAPAPGCATTPLPRGTLRSTGGFLLYADCFLQRQGTRAVNAAADAAGAPELGFSDAERPDESGSPLNQPNPWGDPSDEPAARAFDCGEPQDELAVRDPTGGGLREAGPLALTDEEGRFATLRVPALAPGLGEGASPAGTLNETQAAATDCDRDNPGEVVDVDGQDAGSDAGLPYFLEGSAPAAVAGARTRTDFVLAFEEGDRRGGAAMALGRGSADANTGAVSITGLWAGVAAAPLQSSRLLSRQESGVAPPPYVTFYASISPGLVVSNGLSLPPGATPLPYGAQGCASGAFECDPARWWRSADGEDAAPRDARLGAEPGSPTLPLRDPSTEIGARVGQSYQLRDVDCADMSARPARDAGLQWGALTRTACDRA